MNYIDVNGVSLRYELSGEGAATLVLIHEMGGALESWNEALPALSRGRRVLRYDTRSAGSSEKREEPITIDEMTGDLIALLDALGIKGKVALAGCAVGAGIAIHTAAARPDRVAALVAMAPSIFLSPEGQALAYRRTGLAMREGMRALDAGFQENYPAELRAAAPHRYEAIRGRYLANHPASYAAVYRMLADMDLRPELAGIECPALVIAGTLDPTRPPPIVKPVAEGIRGARYLELRSGHYMPAMTPDLVAEAIVPFLEKAGI